MKKTFLSLLLAFISIVATQAATVGYTTGYYSRFQSFRFGTGTEQGEAIRFSKAKLQQLKGKSIQGVQAVFTTRNTQDNAVTVFLTKDLEGTPICEKTYTLTSSDISSSSAKWNEKTFDTPYTITGDEECLYVGFKVEGAANITPYSADFTNGIAGCSYVIKDGKWTDLADYGYGNVNLRMLVDDVPETLDVMTKQVSFYGYFQSGKEYTFTGQIYNYGTVAVTSFDAAIEGGTGGTLHFEGLNIKPGEVYDFSLPVVSAPEPGTIHLGVQVSNINGGKDADDSDNSFYDDVFFYPAEMERSMLVEEFTSQACTACPQGHAIMAKAMESTPYSHVEVMHHSGYQPDIFTMEESGAYTLFYGGSTFAPAAMVNRAHYPTYSGPAVDFIAGGVTTINTLLDFANGISPYVSLKLESGYNAATREASVKLHVKAHTAMPTESNVLNVMLVQGSYEAYQVNGGNNYVHKNIFRGNVTNNVWGLSADFTPGKDVVYEKTFTLPEKIRASYWTENALKEAGKTEEDICIPANADDMYLVAYVAQYTTPDDPSNNVVFNTVRVKLGESYTQGGYDNGTGAGVETIKEEDAPGIRIEGRRITVDGMPEKVVVYDVAGQAYEADAVQAPGMYIVKVTAGGKTTSRKIIIR